ncbi:sensor domain-containing protein [Pseudoroseomonas wenyumeiae]
MVVVTPERTSAKLRTMGLRDTLMIHFRHGAGDRAPESERRQSAFDLVVVPGEKDLRRAAEKGYLPPAKLRAGGYLKLEFLSRLTRTVPPIFDNDRPVVLFNPHFDATISSLPWARQVIEQFAGQSRYNLVFAPHLRAAENMDTAEREAWLRLARDGQILVDLDSPRLIDMSYALAADIYLGDMSSQLYEFLVRPRPVAFLNAHHAAWRDDPRFAGWALGEVAEAPEDVISTIDRAVAGQPDRAARQQAAVQDAFGDVQGAALRGAQVIAAALADRAAGPHPETAEAVVGASA